MAAPAHHLAAPLTKANGLTTSELVVPNTRIDRVVHHSVILEFAVPSYRTDAAQQRSQQKEVNRQN